MLIVIVLMSNGVNVAILPSPGSPVGRPGTSKGIWAPTAHHFRAVLGRSQVPRAH